MLSQRGRRIRGKVGALGPISLTSLLTKLSDEYCPHCDNHFVLDAMIPKPVLEVEGGDVRVDSRMLRDDRVRREQPRSIFNVKDAPDRLG